MHMMYNNGMEVPITQFRQRVFELVDQALEGKEVWVKHKGRRVRIVAERAVSKLSRVTPLDIIRPGVDIDDDSWKADMMREWEQKWDRKLGIAAQPVRRVSAPVRVKARKTRRKP
jgi:antitoxin (DNA-binding transcriptional repressor) of toxin-antitoxin stability system